MPARPASATAPGVGTLPATISSRTKKSRPPADVTVNEVKAVSAVSETYWLPE